MSSDDSSTYFAGNARFLDRLVNQKSTKEVDRAPSQEVVGAWALTPVGKRAGLTTYMRQLYKRRHFIWADSKARAFSDNRSMMLGNLWLVLMPVVDGLFYFTIFGLVLNVSRDIDNYIAFLLIGIFMFQFTARAISSGATSITGARNMIRAFMFPRASLPIAVVTRETISMIPVVATMAALIVVLPPHVQITWQWALFPVVFALHLVFNLGIALIAARLTARIQDLRHLLNVFARFWRYGSAVMFPIDMFINDPVLLGALEANPLFIIIDMYRTILMDGQVPHLKSWALLALWSIGLALVGFLFFWQAEESYGRE